MLTWSGVDCAIHYNIFSWSIFHEVSLRALTGDLFNIVSVVEKEELSHLAETDKWKKSKGSSIKEKYDSNPPQKIVFLWTELLCIW